MMSIRPADPSAKWFLALCRLALPRRAGGPGLRTSASRKRLVPATRGADARRYETLGFYFLATGDQLGGPAPFALLTAAAAVTERVRLRTYVLNVGFWAPALLAREAATLDVLSDGRLELGIGAGTVRDELIAAGVPWRPLANGPGRWSVRT